MMKKKDVIYLCFTVALFSSSTTLMMYVIWPIVAIVWIIVVFAVWCWSFANPDEEESK